MVEKSGMVKILPVGILNALKRIWNERVPESEGRGGELIGNSWVERVQISLGISNAQGPHSKLGHIGWAQNDGQPLLVDDVLVLCYNNPSRLLKHPLIVPAGVIGRQKSGDSVVLAHPYCVHYYQVELLIDPDVACKSKKYDFKNKKKST